MKAILLDADGVVLQKGEYFSEKFAREYQLPPEEVREFFKGPFSDCQKGTKDLKEELEPYLEKWNWQGTVDDFLDYWFEDVVIDKAIYAFIEKCHDRGIACYLASNNEKYRARVIEKKLGDTLDSYFFSADLEMKKNDPRFFKKVLEELKLSPNDVTFVDNDGENVEVAKELGIAANLYNVDIFAELLNSEIKNEFKIS